MSSLISLSPVLFVRSISFGHHHRQAPAFLSQRQPGGSEVKEDGPSFFREVYVIRLHVPVQITLRVNFSKAIEHPKHDLYRDLRVHSHVGLFL